MGVISMWRLGSFVVLALYLIAAPASPATAGPSGVISGIVSASLSGLPLADVCVYASPVTDVKGHWVASGAQYEAASDGAGNYQMNVPVAMYAVRFDPTCQGTLTSSYAIQYYSEQPNPEDANPVFASAITPATSIDAELEIAYTVSGTVNTASGPGIGDVCASALDPAGKIVNSARTASDGAFTIGGLPSGTYTFYFDPTCGSARHSTYATQYYNNASDEPSATKVRVDAAIVGIDPTLVKGASISGTVRVSGATNLVGICAFAVESDGAVVGRAVTNDTGAYRVANLPPSTYRVRFDPTCEGAATSYYNLRLYPSPISLVSGQAAVGADTTLTLKYGPPLSITTATLPVGMTFSSYLAVLSFRGPSTEAADYKWTASGLPRGLRLIGNMIGGRPQQSGLFTITVKVTTIGSVPPIQTRRVLAFTVRKRSAGAPLTSPMRRSQQSVAPRLVMLHIQ
jgi:hypothetical protein